MLFRSPVFCPWPGVKVLWRWPEGEALACAACQRPRSTMRLPLFVYGPTERRATSKPVCNLRCLLVSLMGRTLSR